MPRSWWIRGCKTDAHMIEGATKRIVVISGLERTVWEMGQGSLVLCLHGFPDSPHTFRHLLPALARAGYRAAAPVMRGYEPSSQPATADYSMAALSEDVVDLANALDASPAHLVGHDWGASIAYAAAARAPKQWRSLTTLAVPHPVPFAAAMASDHGQLKRSWYIFLFQLRGLAEGVISADGFALLRSLWRDWSPGWTPESSDVHALTQCFGAPGVLEAALAYYRTALDPTHPRADEVAAIWAHPLSTPTLGLVGEDDGCISADIFQASMPAAMFPAGVEVVRMKGLGHFLHLEAPASVNERIVQFIARHSR